MPIIDWVPFLSLGLIAIFTPGPNNISCASMGVRHGYKKTLNYILGIVIGFFLLMLTCAFVAGTLSSLLPSFETILHFAGAGYIAWLAVETLRASYAFDLQIQKPMGFWRGLILQVLNPKAIVYGITIYSTFLIPIRGNISWQIGSALFFAILVFLATSTWTLFGSAIRRYLNQPLIQKIVNTVLAVLLLYTAVQLSGLLP
jgi:cysteine/O-acetylserine efflux protein